MFLLQWEWVLGNDGSKVVDFFDRDQRYTLTGNQQTWVMSRVASGPTGWSCTISFYPCCVLPASLFSSFLFSFPFFFLFLFVNLTQNVANLEIIRSIEKTNWDWFLSGFSCLEGREWSDPCIRLFELVKFVLICFCFSKKSDKPDIKAHEVRFTS